MSLWFPLDVNTVSRNEVLGLVVCFCCPSGGGGGGESGL